jgi:hypothetical protein
MVVIFLSIYRSCVRYVLCGYKCVVLVQGCRMMFTFPINEHLLFAFWICGHEKIVCVVSDTDDVRDVTLLYVCEI